jgi:WD40 repeat protein
MRRLCGPLVVLAFLALVCLGATETLRNRSGKTASGVTITFSEKVRITSYDESVFSEQDPTGRADVFTFGGGQLANGGSFRVTWTPSSATVEDSEWLASESPSQGATADTGNTASAASSGSVSPLRTLTFPSVDAVAMSHDGALIAVAGSSSVYVVESKQWTVTRTLTATATIMSVALSPDGRLLAAGMTDDTLCVWDVSSALVLRVLSGRPNTFAGLAFSPDGRLLASTTSGKTISLWDVATWRELSGLVGLPLPGMCLAFSANSKLLAAATIDSSVGTPNAWIVLWNTGTGQWIQRLHSWSWAMAFSPDGRLLASAGLGGGISLWDVATGQVLRDLSGHTGAVNSVAFSPDGKLLASASGDNTLRLWRVSTGEALRTFTGHTNQVTFVDFSPDGKLLISAAYDNTVKIWSIEY